MNYRRMAMFGVMMVVCLMPLYYAYQYFSVVVEKSEIRRPNVILISIDTCQYGAVGVYGNSTVYTPFLDKLAQNGVAFQRGYAPIPTTGASHATMLTGRSPCSHKVFRNAMKYSGEFVTLAKLLKDSGYQTAAFVSGYSLTARTCGLDTGFDLYDDTWSERMLERSADEAIVSCINWLEDRQSKPFFIWLHLFDPHTPYQKHNPYFELIDNEFSDVAAKETVYTDKQVANHQKHVESAMENNDFMVLVKHPMSKSADPETVRSNWNSYLSEVSYVDSQLTAFRQYLSKNSVWDQSLVVLTADHGEGFDHSYYFAHGDRLWESAVRVPWIVKFPNNHVKNIISRSIARHEDIFPTIKEFCNVQFPVMGIEGTSLKNSMKYNLIGGAPAWMTIAPELPRQAISNGTVIAAYEPHFKLISTQGEPESRLYLVTQDPAEENPVNEDYPKVFERMSQRLDRYRRFCRIPQANNLTTNEVLQSDQLKALGYIE